jgi:DNA-binding transcriptional ArsR family regulator
LSDEPDITVIGAAMAEPARAKMLSALMDGRALTATELALEAEVTPSTASSHLAKLRRAGLVTLAAQGRHRYFRIASSPIATLLESLMGIAATSARLRPGPRDEALRRARVCYDHLAGAHGVTLLERMRARRLVRGDGGALEVTAAGEAWLGELGIDVATLRQRSRPLVRACLDWSERRDHLAGAVGAALLARLFELRLARREAPGRALAISPRGEAFLVSLDVPRR